MYIKIDTNRTWTYGGVIYEHGVHEVTDDVAARAAVLIQRYDWKHIAVYAENPGEVAVNPNARAGTLTTADLALGTEGAKKADKDAADKAQADAAAALAAGADAAATADQAPQPFTCDEDGCTADFPSKSALKRHKTMNHKPGEVETAAGDGDKDATGNDGETVTDEVADVQDGDNTPEADGDAAGDDSDDATKE